ncbi:MAG: hypothetical protein K2O16_19995 [Lachnospiraceae bacterium]|nr:hypothetical protein [Lachnospiraceae bacterium]
MGKAARRANTDKKEKSGSAEERARVKAEKARLKEQNRALKKAARSKAEKVKKDVSKKAGKKVKDIQFTAGAVRDIQGKSDRSIMQTLLAAFLVPVVMMVVLGIVSYNTASSGILSKYRESAVSTVSALGDYCNLICDSISGKALEIATNNNLADYYYYVQRDPNSTKAMEAFRSTKSLIANARAVNKYMHSCSVIPDGGSYMTTLSGTMTENPYTDFEATAEGAFFKENPTIKHKWMGYHTYIDSNLSSSPDRYALVFYQKILKGNTTVVMDVDMNVVTEMLSRMDFGDGSIRALVSTDGREIISIQGQEGEAAGEAYFVGNSYYESTKDAEEAGSREVEVDGEQFVYIYSPVGKTGNMICALIPRSNLLGQVGSIKYITFIMVILAAGTALVIGGIISTGISRTVKSMTVELSAVAGGDLSRNFTTKRKDEFKVLTASLNSTIESIRLLMKDMKQFGGKVSELSANVSDKTATINISMQDIARAMDEVSLGVSSQAHDTENSNQKMVSFSENISTVTQKTLSMTETADRTIDAVEQGKVIVQELGEKSDTTVSLTEILVRDIDEVQKSSEEITGFVDVINNIAEQTNLLSLNASIEAARAGEAGRGFAVVAEEIRKLADQSKESGNKIRSIVENIGSTTNKTTASAKKAAGMVNDQAHALEETIKVFGMIQTCVGDLVEGIRIVTDRLGQVMEEEETVRYAIQNISSVSEEVAASTEEVTATIGGQVSVIEKLKEEVEVLSEDAAELGKSIDRFRI